MAEHAFQAKQTEVVEFSGSKYGLRARSPRSLNIDGLADVAKFAPDHLNQNSAWFGHQPFAAWLVKELNPNIFVELGVHWGHSYFAFCQAIQEAGCSTKAYGVDTWQGDEHAGQYGEEVFATANEFNRERYEGFSRLLRMRFDEAASYFSSASIDLLHIDGLHTYEAALHDFEIWLPKLAPGAVVLFHDINVRERNFGLWRLWEELRVSYPLHLEFVHSHGLGVLQLNPGDKGSELPWLSPNAIEDQHLLKRYFSALGNRQAERYELFDAKKQAAHWHQTLAERHVRVAVLDQAVAERDEKILSLDRSLTQGNARIALLDQALSDRDARISRLTQTVAEHAERIGSLDQALTQRDCRIFDLDQSLAHRDNRISELDRTLAELGDNISGLHQTLAQRHEAISGLEQSILSRDQDIVGLQQTLREQAARAGGHAHSIAILEETLGERNRLTAELSTAAEERQQRLVQLEQHAIEYSRTIAALAATIEEFRNSTSWRVSRPLRTLGRLKRETGETAAWVAQQLARESILALLRKTLQVWRREGYKGLVARARQRHFITAPSSKASDILGHTGLVGASTDLTTADRSEQIRAAHRTVGITLSPATLARDRDGRYSLAVPPGAYTYVEPRRPADFDAWLAALKAPPRFAVVVPIYNTPPDLMEAMCASVRSQWYPNWQLILVDDASPAEETRIALARIDHPQIRVMRLEQNQGIAAATNAAITAVGPDIDFVVFLDHDDEITVDCLYELARCIERDEPDFIYSDEDKITAEGDYGEPHFKPDWSPDTMMSTMFTCHVSCIRQSVLHSVGGLRSQFDGCQDWDFVLRVSERTRRISHIPRVLYHWRVIPGSTAASISAKPYILESSRAVREDALQRRGTEGHVEAVKEVPGYFRVVYAVQGNPLISIVIPTRDNGRMLQRCIDSIERQTRTERCRYEIVVLDNGSVDPDSVAYLEEIASRKNIQVIRHDAPFNFSELNNLGVKRAKGDLLLFLNDDIEVLQADWLDRLGGYAQQSHVGAVGAKLLFPGGYEIQHAGVLNLSSGPVHAFRNQPADAPGYFMRNLLEYNWLAVTGACLMIDRRKFAEIAGFCETLPVAYNDVDLCMRLVSAGYYNVVCPAVRLIHHESATRGSDAIDPSKVARLQRELTHLYQRNQEYFQRDPFHNSNLHPNGIHFEVPA